MGLPLNSVAIASRESKSGESKTYALAFFEPEIGKDFPDFALKNSPIGGIKRAIAKVIGEAALVPGIKAVASDPKSLFLLLLQTDTVVLEPVTEEI